MIAKQSLFKLSFHISNALESFFVFIILLIKTKNQTYIKSDKVNISLQQGWGTCLLSRTAWITEYRWRAATINYF